jgi:PAS domain S-box-containing protein
VSADEEAGSGGAVGSALVVNTDLSDGIVYASPSAESVLGRGMADLEQRHVSHLFHSDDRAALEALQERARAGRAPMSGVFRLADRSGGSVVMEVTVAPTESGLSYTMRDTQEREESRIALEAALSRERQAANALREANAAKDALLLAASHDLSSPVAAVAGLADRLLQHPDLPGGELHRIADGIVTASSQLRSILLNLLDADRVLGGHVVVHKQPTDLRGLVLHSVNAHGLAASSVEPRSGQVLAVIDAGLTARIVDNVVGNALRHTPAGTQIRLFLEIVDGEVILEVADRGPGVPDDLKRTIFEPFHRQRPGGSGLGLGLVVVRRFAELQGGRTWVEDTAGGGATFKVAFPAVQAD